MDAVKALQRVIVVGASQGGVTALRTLVSTLDVALPAAVLVVQHQSPDSPRLLADILNSAGPLPAAYAMDGEPLVPGRIYLASPDRHLVVAEDRVQVLAGPRENRARPAIDPLFRSAAVVYGARCVGVLLTGLLYDGTAGLAAVRRCGGVTIVQKPEEAAYPEMITNAMAAVAVDYSLSLVQISQLLNQLAAAPVTHNGSIPEALRLEVAFGQRAMGGAEMMEQLGEPTSFTCPDCGGRLWQMDGADSPRYRCEVGHAFAAASLAEGNREKAEEALWVAMRTLEERERMLEQMARQAEANGRSHSALNYHERAAETEKHKRHLRHFLLEWLQTTGAKTHTEGETEAP